MVTFSLKEMFLLGWPILSLLLACSILSFAVILERWIFFRKKKVVVHDFLEKMESVTSPQELKLKYSSLGEPMATIAEVAIHSKSGNEELINLQVDRAVRMQVGEMERFVPLLGSIAAVAPFIGLLGTVIGIIRAFKSLSLSGGGGPQIVASGIAEALVATAVGLIVAIPSLLAYNYFSVKVRRTTENIEICADRIVELFTQK